MNKNTINKVSYSLFLYYTHYTLVFHRIFTLKKMVRFLYLLEVMEEDRRSLKLLDAPPSWLLLLLPRICC